MSRICEYELCTKDLDQLGKRPDARFCSGWHKDEQRRVDERSAAIRQAQRNRETRAITLTLARAIDAVREGYLLAIRDLARETNTITVRPKTEAVQRAAERIAAKHLTPAARAEYDRRKAAGK